MKIGIVAGSFDPITNGHTWLISQSVKLMHKLYVVIGVNPAKKSLFTPEERKDMIERTLKAELAPEDFAKLRIRFLEKELLINFAIAKKAHYIFRGIRTTKDFNYEAQMQLVNRKLSLDVETMFMIPPRELTEVSSSTVKGLLGFKGWEEATRGYVSESVFEALLSKTPPP